jgi:hypothetical protein
MSVPALAWPASMSPLSKRLGYTVSKGVYLPAVRAIGVRVTVTRGTARIHAGPVDATSHRLLTSLVAGQSHRIANLYAGEVVSVQGNTSFTYTIERPAAAAAFPCSAPAGCGGVVESVPSRWRCNVSSCSGSEWVGHTVTWPAWAAYESNGRLGISSRTVYSTDGRILYPYMGAWADGCEVTAVTGKVLIIEWKRGAAVWRQRSLQPGETYVIDLVGSEDGAMIETADGAPFSVTLNNCNPRPVPDLTRPRRPAQRPHLASR